MRPGLRVRERPSAPALASLALLAGVAAYTALVFVELGAQSELRDLVLYNGLLIASALFCLARPLLRKDGGLPWLLVGLGLSAWVIGDLWWEYAYASLEEVPFPSISDAFYLALYPLVFAGLGLGLRARLREARLDLWLDGFIAALATAAVVAALVFDVVVETEGLDFWAFWTNLAYPSADLGLICLVVVVLAVTGWKLDRVWSCVLAGALVFSFADTAYLYQSALGTYVEGTLTDAGWLAGIALIAVAAWQPRRPVVSVRAEGFLTFALPAFSGSLALSLLVYDHYNRLHTVALVLSTLAVAAVIGRMALTFRRNAALLVASRRDAETDALTGLPNRRRLLADLEARLEGQVPSILVLFDLDGFKAYNDAFGHPAGDALLHRLAAKLGVAAEPFGTAYRMGGDEFCVIADGDGAERSTVVSTSLRALRDESEGFRITSAYGAALLPAEASDLSEALRIADTRLYGNKDSRRASAGRQTREVLLSVLHERDERATGHLSAVARLAGAVGARLGLDDAELKDLALAAELHDVGKLAIPDSILNKPGPLTEDEWVFVHRHTQIGERILGSAPALARIGALVRSTHERLDGLGYPDGLIGDEIPLLARIISACDALYAMTEDRPYRAAIPVAQALSELQRCSGSQFDPLVVDALVAALREHDLQLVA